MGASCTFNHLRVHMHPGVSPGNFTVTLQVNGIPRALACSVVNPATDCTSSIAVPVVAGDLVQFVVSGSSAPPFSTFLRCQ
jgi:hypothetical protein